MAALARMNEGVINIVPEDMYQLRRELSQIVPPTGILAHKNGLEVCLEAPFLASCEGHAVFVSGTTNKPEKCFIASLFSEWSACWYRSSVMRLDA